MYTEPEAKTFKTYTYGQIAFKQNWAKVSLKIELALVNILRYIPSSDTEQCENSLFRSLEVSCQHLEALKSDKVIGKCFSSSLKLEDYCGR